MAEYEPMVLRALRMKPEYAPLQFTVSARQLAGLGCSLLDREFSASWADYSCFTAR